MKTEDEVRSMAETILGLDENENNVQQGTGQITTFNQLGFKGQNNKPDGWYLPNNTSEVALILETKSEKEKVDNQKWIKELKKNIEIASSKYRRIVGLLYNGVDVLVIKYDKKLIPEGKQWETVLSVPQALQPKSYYLTLFRENKIDKQKIYALTKRINDCLHVHFGIKDLYHRMIMTACALVAKRYGATLFEGMDFSLMTNSILNTLSKSLEEDKKQNLKLDILIEVYSSIKMNRKDNQEAINNFITWVSEISDSINSDFWNGEDVMGIFFNEFNRYKKKSDSGQIFTPDHITSFMYRLIDVNKDDRVLDATCGSGAFLVKAMCNMIKEAGGVNTKEAKKIKSSQLYGIEFDRQIFALACANMLIHKDGKTNLEQMDARSEDAAKWIKGKEITKVLMNPPYERKYGCMKIVSNVLDSVPKGTLCAFILPDKKLEKDYVDKKFGNKVLKKHTLKTIVKLPENLFFGVGITTSIFIFETGKPQKGKNIIGYYIDDDGLETVKNQGRQDIKDRWHELEDYWVQAVHDGEEKRYGTKQVINPSERLSYQKPIKPFTISEEDFMETMLNHEMYVKEVEVEDFRRVLLKHVLYDSRIKLSDDKITITINRGNYSEDKRQDDASSWGKFVVGDLMDKVDPKILKKNFDKRSDTSEEKTAEFSLPLVNAKHGHNGIMFYGRESDFESVEMCLDIVQNGAIATGDVYAQIDKVGVLWDAYLVKPKEKISPYALLFLSKVMQKTIKERYAYNDKAIWEKVKNETILLPMNTSGKPNWSYMHQYMKGLEKRMSKNLTNLSFI